MPPKLSPLPKMENVSKGAIPKKETTKQAPKAKRKKNKVEESSTGLTKKQLHKLAKLISKDTEHEKNLIKQFTIMRDTLQTLLYVQQQRIENLASANRNRSNMTGELNLLTVEKRKAEATLLYQVYRNVKLESEMHKIYECEVDKLRKDGELMENFVMEDLEHPFKHLEEIKEAMEMGTQMSENMDSQRLMEIKKNFQCKVEDMLSRHQMLLRKMFQEIPARYQQKIKSLEEKYNKIIKDAVEKHEQEINEIVKNYSEVTYDNLVLIDKIKATINRFTGESHYRRIQLACQRTEENIDKLTKELESTKEKIKTIKDIMSSQEWSELNSAIVNDNYNSVLKEMEDMHIRKSLVEMFSQQGCQEKEMAQGDLLLKSLEYQERENLNTTVKQEKIRILERQVKEREEQISHVLNETNKSNKTSELWNKVKLCQEIMQKQDQQIQFLEEMIEKTKKMLKKRKRKQLLARNKIIIH